LELRDVIRQRRMTRAFEPTPLRSSTVDRILAAGLRGPAAGNTQAVDLVVLEGPDETARYWDVALPDAQRPTFPWPRLLDAPLLVIPFTRPEAYAERYREADKAHTGLGAGADRWPVPYWYVDAAFAALLMMLVASDEGLGVLFFGLFEHEAALRDSLGVPAGHRAVGALAIGHAHADERSSRSAQRPRRSIDDAVHRGSW
jgi:nitroreductase